MNLRTPSAEFRDAQNQSDKMLRTVSQNLWIGRVKVFAEIEMPLPDRLQALLRQAFGNLLVKPGAIIGPVFPGLLVFPNVVANQPISKRKGSIHLLLRLV